MIFKKLMLITAIISSQSAAAAIRPVMNIGAGLDFVNFHQVQNVTLIAPFQNTFYMSNSDDELFGNIFLGLEAALWSNFLGQVGVSYYQSIPFIPMGTEYQFTDSNMGNLYYKFRIKSYRVLLEAKLLATVKEYIHPYFLLGIGRVTNNSYHYTEIPVASTDVPMAYTFANRSYSSYAYDIGLGADFDVTQHVRFGLGYRYTNIGTAGLGLIPAQDSTSTIKFTQLYLNEYLATLSYLW